MVPLSSTATDEYHVTLALGAGQTPLPASGLKNGAHLHNNCAQPQPKT